MKFIYACIIQFLLIHSVTPVLGLADPFVASMVFWTCLPISYQIWSIISSKMQQRLTEWNLKGKRVIDLKYQHQSTDLIVK